MGRYLWKTMPANFWLAVVYLITMLSIVISGAESVESTLNTPLTTVHLFVGEDGVQVTGTLIMIVLAFVAQWIEAIRATAVKATERNDTMSLVVAFAVLAIFLGVPGFQTTAFFAIVVVSFGDLLLDRIIGQAVARRDFGFNPGGE